MTHPHTDTMRPEPKRQLVAALRSGDYPQGRGMLRSPGGAFCVFGVLCEVAARQGVIPPAVATAGGGFTYAGRGNTLPAPVAKWSGLEHGGVVDGVSLAHLNDEGASFDALAKLIDEKL